MAASTVPPCSLVVSVIELNQTKLLVPFCVWAFCFTRTQSWTCVLHVRNSDFNIPKLSGSSTRKFIFVNALPLSDESSFGVSAYDITDEFLIRMSTLRKFVTCVTAASAFASGNTAADPRE